LRITTSKLLLAISIPTKVSMVQFLRELWNNAYRFPDLALDTSRPCHAKSRQSFLILFELGNKAGSPSTCEVSETASRCERPPDNCPPVSARLTYKVRIYSHKTGRVICANKFAESGFSVSAARCSRPAVAGCRPCRQKPPVPAGRRCATARHRCGPVPDPAGPDRWTCRAASRCLAACPGFPYC